MPIKAVNLLHQRIILIFSANSIILSFCKSNISKYVQGNKYTNKKYFHEKNSLSLNKWKKHLISLSLSFCTKDKIKIKWSQFTIIKDIFNYFFLTPSVKKVVHIVLKISWIINTNESNLSIMITVTFDL